MKKNKYSIAIIKNYLRNKKLVESKLNRRFINGNNFGSLSRTLLSSFIVVSFFFVSPVVLDFVNEKSLYNQDFENNSKNNFTKLLEDPSANLDEGLDNKFLFEDILNFDKGPVDTVRLSASTIE